MKLLLIPLPLLFIAGCAGYQAPPNYSRIREDSIEKIEPVEKKEPKVKKTEIELKPEPKPSVITGQTVKPGLMKNPNHSMGLIDISEMTPGSKIEDPYTGEILIVP